MTISCSKGCCSTTEKVDLTSRNDNSKSCCADIEAGKKGCCAVNRSSCSTEGTCSSNNKPKEVDTSSVCLAVVRPSRADVVLFDVSGDIRYFSYQASAGRKLCFSSHGQDTDDLLTPCFDEDGNHGEPEEICFCGVETPHLHAHFHDPQTCEKEPSDRDKNDLDFSYLAKLTLHPNEEGEMDGLLHIPVSDQMPKQCNSEALLSHMNDVNIHRIGKRSRRRMHKVQHDDHIDYLVHDFSTDRLHLEHPCNDCGRDDVHGRFHLVGKRRLKNVAGGDDVGLHFFEVASSAFSLQEFFSDMFVTDSARVAAVRLPCCSSGKCRSGQCISSGPSTTIPSTTTRSVDMKPGTTLVRSSYVCTRICCSSEVPMIKKVVEPLDGVVKILINVPLKQVLIDHDPQKITAEHILSVLNKNSFGASLKQEGGAVAGVQTSGNTVGRSQFYVKHICCASEIPVINSIVRPIDGVVSVSINVTTKTVYVDHDTNVVSAKSICDSLNANAMGASVRQDAAKNISSAETAFVRSVLAISDSNANFAEESINDFFSTFESSQLESFDVDIHSRTISFVHNPLLLSAENISLALEERKGVQATILCDGAENVKWEFPAVDIEESAGDEEKVQYPRPAVILSGVFWIISMFSYVGGNWDYLKYVGLLSVSFGIPTIAYKAYRTMSNYKFDSNCLMLFAALGALALQEYMEAAAVTFLFAISEWLEVRATARARHALSEIVRLRPEIANLIHPNTKEVVVVHASAVPVGAYVAVKVGDKVPCDGVVIEGCSTVDESSLTGESRPVRKAPKSKVSGGTINSGTTQLVVQTTSTADNSAVSRLIRLVEEAQANRSETEKLVDEFAKFYTPVVVLAALCMCTIPWAFGPAVGRTWTNNGLVLIVIACPCALIISTPVTYVAGLAATAQRGVVIKGGAHLEALGLVSCVCFDKTGTLTQGCFALMQLEICADQPYSRAEVIQFLSAMEERATHPLAQAILVRARNEGIKIPKNMSVKEHTFLPGEGVTGFVNGLEVMVGNERLFKRKGVYESVPINMQILVANWEAMGSTVGFMSIEGAGIVCAYSVADAVRQESMDIVQQLSSMKISSYMLTGDKHESARGVGKLVGMNDNQIRSELLPEDKLSFISGLNSGSRRRSILANPFNSRKLVLMCGDGVNDAPALAAADVGVAMGAGAAVAMETADVTLLDSNLSKLVYSIQMGRRVIWKIKENVVFSIVVKFAVLAFALAGYVHLWTAIASDVGSMILVTLNGMRLLPQRRIDHDVMGEIQNQTYRSQATYVSQPSEDPDDSFRRSDIRETVSRGIGRSGGYRDENNHDGHHCDGHHHDDHHHDGHHHDDHHHDGHHHDGHHHDDYHCDGHHHDDHHCDDHNCDDHHHDDHHHHHRDGHHHDHGHHC